VTSAGTQGSAPVRLMSEPTRVQITAAPNPKAQLSINSTDHDDVGSGPQCGLGFQGTVWLTCAVQATAKRALEVAATGHHNVSTWSVARDLKAWIRRRPTSPVR
jgi:hypothetical protein